MTIVNLQKRHLKHMLLRIDIHTYPILPNLTNHTPPMRMHRSVLFEIQLISNQYRFMSFSVAD